MERIEQYHLIRSFGYQWAGSWYVSTRNMVAELLIVLDVLVDDLEDDCLGDKDGNFMFLAAAASIFARRDLNQILGYFEQTIVMYSLDEFQAHFCMQRAICESTDNKT